MRKCGMDMPRSGEDLWCFKKVFDRLNGPGTVKDAIHGEVQCLEACDRQANIINL